MEEAPLQSASAVDLSSNLRAAVVLADALHSISHSIRVFSAKWTSIRAKLDLLSSNLTSVDCSSSKRSELSQLLVDVLTTLYELDDLARRCLEVSFSGNLLMQSDLDVMVSKLETHVKKLSGVVGFGGVGGADAMVVVRPGFGACRDDIRFYLKDLMRRVKIGGVEMRKEALRGLYEAMVEEERYVKMVVEVEADGSVLDVLVGLMDDSDVGVQEECVKVLAFVSGFGVCRFLMIGAGVVAALVRVLENGSEVGREGSARCLMRLTANADNAWAVSAHGGVSLLMAVCRNEEVGGELIGLSCKVLRNLVGVDEIKRFVVEHGVVSMLIKLVKSRDEPAQIGAMELLYALADGDESVRVMIVGEGGIRALLRVSDPRSSSTLKSREVAITAIDKLCFSSASSTSLLISYGYLDQLLYFLRNGEVSCQELALKSVYKLSNTSDEAKKMMGDIGFMPQITKFLSAKSSEVQEIAAMALHKIISVPKNLRRFAQDNHNISFILQLLDPDAGKELGNRTFLLSVLTAITSCNSGRRKIVNSGYVKNIEKLAQSEVTDAKRIVKRLYANRFTTLLTGIWRS